MRLLRLVSSYPMAFISYPMIVVGWCLDKAGMCLFKAGIRLGEVAKFCFTKGSER